MNKHRFIILIAAIGALCLSATSYSADNQFGATVQGGAGVSPNPSSVYMMIAASDAVSGTMDSIVFYARNNGNGVDTIYGCIYTESGGDPDQLVAVSADSVHVDQNVSLQHYVVTFSSGSIDASTNYFVGVTIRSLAGSCQFEYHDDDGSPDNNVRTSYTDVWPLETTAPAGAGTGYAPYVEAWYTSGGGAVVVKLQKCKTGAIHR